MATNSPGSGGTKSISTRNAIVLSAFIALAPTLATGRADDFAGVIEQASVIATSNGADLRVVASRRHGGWEICGLALSSDHLTEVGAHRIGGIRSLVDFMLYGAKRPDVDLLRCIAGIPGIQRLAFGYPLAAQDLRLIATFPNLRFLILGTYEDATLDGDGLSALTNVRCLDLSGRSMGRAWAKSVGSLAKLEVLNISRNRDITDLDLAELRNLVNLRELRVGESERTTDVGVAQLKNLVSLRFLEINRVGAEGLAGLRKLPRLEHLGVGSCEPGVSGSRLADLENMKSFVVRGIVGDGPRPVALPAGLKQLDLPCSEAASFDFRSAKHIENLQVALGSPPYGDRAPRELRWLGTLGDLRELTLYYPIERDMKEISRLEQLRSLRIVANCASAIGNGGARSIGGLCSLESLEVEDFFGGGDPNPRYDVDSGIEALRQLDHLERLVLRGFPAVSAKSLASVTGMKRLRSLELDLTGASLAPSFDEMMARVGTLSDLEQLKLSFTMRVEISDTGLGRLSTLKKLRSLDLARALGFTDAGLASLIRSLPALEEVKFTIRPVATPASRTN